MKILAARVKIATGNWNVTEQMDLLAQHSRNKKKIKKKVCVCFFNVFFFFFFFLYFSFFLVSCVVVWMVWIFLLVNFCFGGIVRVTVFSDVHLNLGPDQSCYFGKCVNSNFSVPQLWCDSPASLVASALQQLVLLEPCPAAFIVPGDVQRHAEPKSAQYMLNTYASLLSMIASAYGPNCAAVATPVIALGNNDLQSRYPPPGTLAPWLSQLVNVLPGTKSLSAADKQTFVEKGVYTMDISNLNIRVVVLHTNFWSIHNSNTKGPNNDPGGLIEWMKQQLENAKTQKKNVWLVGHAAPGVDHYSKEESWHLPIASHFYATVAPYWADGTIATSLFGHEHVLMERRATPDRSDVVLMSGSVSPDKVLRESLYGTVVVNIFFFFFCFSEG